MLKTVFVSDTLILKRMSGAAFIGQKVSRLCSLPQWCKQPSVPAPIYEHTKRNKAPPMIALSDAVDMRRLQK